MERKCLLKLNLALKHDFLLQTALNSDFLTAKTVHVTFFSVILQIFKFYRIVIRLDSLLKNKLSTRVLAIYTDGVTSVTIKS